MKHSIFISSLVGLVLAIVVTHELLWSVLAFLFVVILYLLWSKGS